MLDCQQAQHSTSQWVRPPELGLQHSEWKKSLHSVCCLLAEIDVISEPAAHAEPLESAVLAVHAEPDASPEAAVHLLEAHEDAELYSPALPLQLLAKAQHHLLAGVRDYNLHAGSLVQPSVPRSSAIAQACT